MIYVIAVFGLVIFFALLYVIVSYRFLVDKCIRTDVFLPFSKQFIVEKAYRGVDFQSMFAYTHPDKINFQLQFDPSLQIVRDDEHKQYIIRDHGIKMFKEMVNQGCVEIEEYSHDWNPTINFVKLKAKVYKPEK